MTQVKCVSCGFPISTRGIEGDPVTCPSCGTSGTVTRISQMISIPAPLFAAVMGFGVGMILGPALLKVKERLAR